MLLSKNSINFIEYFNIPMKDNSNPNKENSLKHVLFGSLIGTTIEFFDFYIYANAAVLVFRQFQVLMNEKTGVVILRL